MGTVEDWTIPSAPPAAHSLPDGDRLWLSREYSQLAAAVPGAVWDRDRRAYFIPRDAVTPRHATIIMKVLPHIADEWLMAKASEGMKDMRPTNHADRLQIPLDALHACTTLEFENKDVRSFQWNDCGYLGEVLKEHGGAYLGWERGMGKTWASYAIAEHVNAARVLIVCGNLAKTVVWQDQKHYSHLRDHVQVLPNAKAKREKFIKDLPRTGPLVLVAHYESLDIVGGKSKRGWDKLGEWDLIILDEAHHIKNATSKRSRAVKKIPARMKLAVSGSIVENHMEELFSQLQWLFPDRYSAKWRDWNLRFLDYLENGPYGKIFVGVRPEKVKELQDELGVFMCYRRRRDEIEMPKRTDQVLKVDLTPGQRKIYDDLAGTLVAELPDGQVISADMGLPILSKLRQVASGLDLLGEDLRDSSKIDLCMELIADAPEEDQLVVLVWYKAAGRALEDRLGDQCVRVDGDVPHATRAERVRAFNKGDARVLVGSLATVGESLNLQNANHAILLDRDWNPMRNSQGEDRVDRFGQTKEVHVTHIVARRTCDELRVTPNLASKEAIRRAVFGE